MTRVITGVILAAVFFVVVWFADARVLLVVALAVSALAFHEYATLMHQIGIEIPKIPALLATMGTLAVVPFPYVAVEAVIGVAVIIVAASAMTTVTAADRAAFRPAVLAAAAGALAIVYLGVTLGTMVGVHIYGGRRAVILLIFTVVVSDSAQYYAGRMFGKRKLAPLLSPKKTIAGAVGGFIAAPIFLYFAGPYLVPVGSPLAMAALGIPLTAAGIAGDLFESMLKRAADMKDSSALIPGHGGVLDRIDAMLFATPVFYVYLRFVYGG